jgi:hypothetical protein
MRLRNEAIQMAEGLVESRERRVWIELSLERRNLK